MTQDNIQVDTPQESSNEETYTSLEEAVFGTTEGSNDVSSAFTSGNEGNTETAPVEKKASVEKITNESKKDEV